MRRSGLMLKEWFSKSGGAKSRHYREHNRDMTEHTCATHTPREHTHTRALTDGTE